MSRGRLAALAVCTLLLGTPAAARGQSCTVNSPGQCSINTSASMTVPAVIQVLVSAGSVNPASLADFEAGYGSLTPSTLSVSANTPWALSISAGSATWTATNTLPGVTARPNKPAGDLLWSIDGATYVPLETTTRQIATGPATAGFVRDLSYRVLYSLVLDTPGRYEMTILLTVTAP